MFDPLLVKKFISELIYPPASAIIIFVIGVLVCLVRRKSAIGIIFMILGPVWLLTASLPITGYLLYRSIEPDRSPHGFASELREKGVRKVVVLGNVIEGIRLWKQIPGAVLVISSGALGPKMVERARNMGVPNDAIILETEARDTIEQASKLKPLLYGERFALSTWAVHTPRALAIFRRFGLDPLPAPTDHIQKPLSLKIAFKPSRAGLFMTRIAVHEYVGALWFRLRSPFMDS